MGLRNILAGVTVFVLSTGVSAVSALAAEGAPRPWQMGFQPGVSPVRTQMDGFHDLVLVIITLITLFVLGLLVYVMVRFNARKNATPSRTTHNTLLEVLWTVVPIMILLVIAIPSFKLLYYQNTVPPETDLTIKAIGHQWYWTYEYPDEGFSFDSFMLDEGSLEGDQPRLLATDANVVLPVGKVVRVLVTAADVLHSFAVPALGVKIDAVPGRLNETWMRIDEPGMYYGQCSELCGVQHAFMPIAIEAVSEQDYEAWLETAREDYARRDARTRLADAAGERPGEER